VDGRGVTLCLAGTLLGLLGGCSLGPTSAGTPNPTPLRSVNQTTFHVCVGPMGGDMGTPAGGSRVRAPGPTAAEAIGGLSDLTLDAAARQEWAAELSAQQARQQQLRASLADPNLTVAQIYQIHRQLGRIAARIRSLRTNLYYPGLATPRLMP